MARRWLLLPVLVTLVVGLLGMGVRATHGGQAAVDEPQYLLSALSLAEDGNLDISDELAARRWTAFHQAELPVQTQPLPGGRAVSPHDPLLPVLLAVPMGAFGWVGAKVAMVLMAAATAALLAWVAVRRFGVDQRVAGVAAAVAFASPPLGIYAQQVYPEVPAALATLVAVAAASAPVIRPRHLLALVLAVSALPWLGLKYAAVAAALALGAYAVTRRRVPGRHLLWSALALAGSAAGYLLGHLALYGGATPYATGDQFQATGQLSVVGVHPDYVGRSLRLTGLLVDNTFGLVPWQPALVVAVAAVAVVAVRGRLPERWLLLAPLGAGWATATWVALTMHGFWSPGRQVVVVLPLLVVVVLLALERLPRAVAVPVAALSLGGVVNLAVLLAAGLAGRLTWVTDFWTAPSPVYQLLARVTPDYRSSHFMAGHLAWVVLLLASAAVAVRATRGATRHTHRVGDPAPALSPSPKGTHA
ncbi:MAG: hypothetical protein ACXVYW_05405 [Oryzihumus sp.]